MNQPGLGDAEDAGPCKPHQMELGKGEHAAGASGGGWMEQLPGLAILVGGWLMSEWWRNLSLVVGIPALRLGNPS